MRIIVCVKQVPSTNMVRLDPETHTIIRDGRAAVTNPFDSSALEVALRLKEQLGGQVAALSMGIPATRGLLLDAISRGADRALLLSDRVFAGADTLATSYALSLGVRRLGEFDLILCGKMAVDGDTAQIGPELAEHLGIPHATEVSEIISATEKSIVCRKNVDNGLEELEVPLPALLTVVKDIAQPRLPSISGIRRSLEAGCPSLSAAEVGADPDRCGLAGSPTQVIRSFTPESQGEAQLLTGNNAAIAAAVLNIVGEVRA